MKFRILNVLLFLPLLLSGRVAEIVVKGEGGNVTLTTVDIERLLPGETELDSTDISRLVMYGKKILASKEAGIVASLNFEDSISNELLNDIIVSEWMEQSIAKLLGQMDFETYFQENEERYSWKRPRFKGLLILGVDKSVVNDAYKGLQESGLENMDEIRKEALSRWGKEVSVIPVLAEKGRNTYVDYAVFGQSPDFGKEKWKSVVVLSGKIIERPENWEDVKDEVMHDCRVSAIEEIEKRLEELYEYEIIED